MQKKHSVALAAAAVGLAGLLSPARGASQSPASPDQLVAVLKQNLAESQKRLRQYEWIETTTVSLKGEEKLRVEFKDFVQPSDLLAIDVDAKAAVLSALTVATYLEKKDDAVTLDVRFGTLADGTSYSARTTLDATAKNIRVVVENSGHRPVGQ